MPRTVPAALVDLAIEALEEEVACWQRYEWPAHRGEEPMVRLTRFDPVTLGPAEIPDYISEATVQYHDMPKRHVDDFLVRVAMEKVLETVISAISVDPR